MRVSDAARPLNVVGAALVALLLSTAASAAWEFEASDGMLYADHGGDGHRISVACDPSLRGGSITFLDDYVRIPDGVDTGDLTLYFETEVVNLQGRLEPMDAKGIPLAFFASKFVGDNSGAEAVSGSRFARAIELISAASQRFVAVLVIDGKEHESVVSAAGSTRAIASLLEACPFLRP